MARQTAHSATGQHTSGIVLCSDEKLERVWQTRAITANTSIANKTCEYRMTELM